LGERVHGPGEGTGELVYEQPGNEVDGSCHKRRVGTNNELLGGPRQTERAQYGRELVKGSV
jgi:hypothetical protein